MATKPTKTETSPTTSTDDNLSPGDRQWVEWYEEKKKPSRQRNLTPLQRKQRAEALRLLREIKYQGRDDLLVRS